MQRRTGLTPTGRRLNLPGRVQSNFNPDRKSSINVTDGGGQHLGDERGQGVGGVAVKGMPRAVVAAGSTRIGDVVAVKAKRLRIARHRGATNVGGGGVGERSLLDCVAVEAGQGGQPPGNSGATPAGLFQCADVGLDVAALGSQQPDADPGTPGVDVA